MTTKHVFLDSLDFVKQVRDNPDCYQQSKSGLWAVIWVDEQLTTLKFLFHIMIIMIHETLPGALHG